MLLSRAVCRYSRFIYTSALIKNNKVVLKSRKMSGEMSQQVLSPQDLIKNSRELSDEPKCKTRKIEIDSKNELLKTVSSQCGHSFTDDENIVVLVKSFSPAREIDEEEEHEANSDEIEKPMKDQKEDSKETQEDIGDYSNLKKEINNVLNICKSIIKCSASTEKRKQSGGDDGQKSTKQNSEDEKKSPEITLEKVAQDISTILKDLKDHLDTFRRKSDSFSDVIPQLEKSFNIKSKKGFFKKTQLNPAYNPQNYQNYIPHKRPVTNPTNSNSVLKSKSNSNQSKAKYSLSNSFKSKTSTINSNNVLVTSPKVAIARDNQGKIILISNNSLRIEDNQAKTSNTNRVSIVDNNRVAPVSKPSVDNKRLEPVPESADNSKRAVTNPTLNEQNNQVTQFPKHDGTKAHVTVNNQEKNNPTNYQSRALILTPKGVGKTIMVREKKLLVPYSTSAKDQVKIIPTYNKPEIPATSLFATAEKVIQKKLSYLMPSIYSFHEFIMLSAKKAAEKKMNQESGHKMVTNENNEPKDESMASAVGGNFTDKSLSIKTRLKSDADANARNNILVKSSPAAKSKNQNKRPNSAKPSLKGNNSKGRNKTLKGNVADRRLKTAQSDLKGSAKCNNDPLGVSSVPRLVKEHPNAKQNGPIEIKKNTRVNSKSAKVSSGRHNVLKTSATEMKQKFAQSVLTTILNANNNSNKKKLANKTVENSIQVENKTKQNKILKNISLRPKSAPVCVKDQANLKNPSTDKNSLAQHKVVTVHETRISKNLTSKTSSTQTKRAMSSPIPNLSQAPEKKRQKGPSKKNAKMKCILEDKG